MSRQKHLMKTIELSIDVCRGKEGREKALPFNYFFCSGMAVKPFLKYVSVPKSTVTLIIVKQKLYGTIKTLLRFNHPVKLSNRATYSVWLDS